MEENSKITLEDLKEGLYHVVCYSYKDADTLVNNLSTDGLDENFCPSLTAQTCVITVLEGVVMNIVEIPHLRKPLAHETRFVDITLKGETI